MTDTRRSQAARERRVGAEWLRAQPSLTGTPPVLDLTSLPDNPIEMFDDWLRSAVHAGAPEPHAASLATLDADGVPDARTLIIKEVSDEGWAFAGPRSSRKGAQLAAHPVAALNFWWQPVVRAVRVRGLVREATPAASAADLAARSAAAREDVAPGEWVLWRIEPTRVEFWQGSPDRRHIRIEYLRDGGSWARTHAIVGPRAG
ncbi:pyridoxamine 5'-phosphate oxidase [Microterricola gilva]|uniref:Pyridoxamine 5'-phosphate oxidase n=1 Tax=Microterricola gilva TaxID=393267 RepID=A0A4Q8AQ84_9MICO|nr:pyridoxamine 5'-phosphate oxidase family protein [Microterricola gilva]RZU66768.1 pyridoxamine 5'-phosphate oxidase [Microterricola gilva]